MKTILIATDYSRASTNALEYAAMLAQSTGAKLAIINTYTLSVPMAASATSLYGVKLIMAENQERLEKLARVISITYNIVIEAISINGDIEEVLDRQVRRLGADLVVMGMKGGSFSRKLFGSSTTYIMEHAAYPVLVIPDQAQFNGLSRILLAYDAKCLRENNTLYFLKELAAHYKAKVEILHVVQGQVPEFYEVPEVFNIEEVLDGIDYSFRQLETDRVLDGIQQGIEELKADMLVMVPHKADFWASVFTSSKTRYMSFTSHVPLLVLPNIFKTSNRRAAQTGKESLRKVAG